jgi:flavorubredoxin
MTTIAEIAPDVYRISTFLADGDIQMNQFLVKDDEPLLWHTGQKYLFAEVKEAVSKLIDPTKLRWIGFSHFEPDECGSLNSWLGIAPHAETFCSPVGANVNIRDFASRPARGMSDGEIIPTGKYRFSFHPTPHLPHGWDAGLLFEETNRTLFCSDLFHQFGNPEALTGSDIIEAAKKNLVNIQSGPFKNYIPYTQSTEHQLNSLAELKPKTLAIMHGSSFSGDCERSLREFSTMLKEVLVIGKTS